VVTRRRLAGAGCAAIAVAGLVAVGAFKGAGTAAEAAPALPSQVLSGRGVTIASLRGGPAVVNFWASWCTPCRQEAPQLERFVRTSGRRASVVGVDWNDNAKSARAFVEENRLTYPVLRDASGEVGSSYGLSGLPTTFILDPSGQIAATLRGPQTAAGLRRALASIR
jgi:cytochrome c biogenesis protein CcmG/thiol:disulfide interchange protein DsbE